MEVAGLIPLGFALHHSILGLLEQLDSRLYKKNIKFLLGLDLALW